MDMEVFENRARPESVKSRLGVRAKSSRRLKFEAEVEVLKRELKSLENVRERLGFSRRKMCELLMVDASAWTRWTKPDGEAPPHIYRALQWYLIVHEKYPALNHPFFFSKNVDEKWQKLAAELEKTKRELTNLKKVSLGVGIVAIILIAVFGF